VTRWYPLGMMYIIVAELVGIITQNFIAFSNDLNTSSVLQLALLNNADNANCCCHLVWHHRREFCYELKNYSNKSWNTCVFSVLEKSEKSKFRFSPDATPFVPKNFREAEVPASNTKVSTLSVAAREFYPRNYTPQNQVSFHLAFWCLLCLCFFIFFFDTGRIPSVCYSKAWK